MGYKVRTLGWELGHSWEKLSRIWAQDFMSLLSPSYPGNPPLLSLSSDPAFDQTSVVCWSVAAMLPIFAGNSTILPTFRQQSIDVRQGGFCPVIVIIIRIIF